MGWIAGAYGLLLLSIFFYQSKLLYYPNVPSRDVETTPAGAGLEFEPVRFATEDGLTLDGWFVPRSGARQVILFFHGNAGNISHRIESLQLFHDLGFDCLIFDYRGYGRSDGKPSEQGTYRDAEAAWQYLTITRDIQPQQIVLLGRSLGAAIATQLAGRHTPAALVIESAFTSLTDLAAKIYWFVPVRLLSRYHYPVADYLKSVTSPVLVVHSQDDELIPFAHGRRLFEIANTPKQFLEIRGSHDGGFLETGRLYSDTLRGFLQQYPPKASMQNQVK